MRAAVLVALSALSLGGCECGGPVGSAPAGPISPGPPDALPRASRDDLPSATPALTLSVHRDRFEVDNRALVDTWPRADLDRTVARRPPGVSWWPRLHAVIPAPAPPEGFLVPALQTALEQALAVERARAQDAQVPIAFALRVEAGVPWQRVTQALYTAGLVGWSEPRFLLESSSGRGEVQLAMPLHRDPRAMAEAVLLAVDVRVDRTVRVAVGSRPVSSGCGSVHDAPTEVDAVPSREAAVDTGALSRCLDAARGIRPPTEGAILSADPQLPFRDVVPVLEMLRARYDAVAIAIRP